MCVLWTCMFLSGCKRELRSLCTTLYCLHVLTQDMCLCCMEECSLFDVWMRLSSYVLVNNTVSIWHRLQYAVGMYLIKLWKYATLCCIFSVVQMCVCACECVWSVLHLWTGSNDVEPPSDCCFAAGDREAKCNATIVSDSISESDEMFNIRLSPRSDQCVCNPPDGPNLKVTIVEDDVPGM